MKQTHNRFHTTAMCSPTRASLLTGRNHHRVGNGQIAELANDWDGYSGQIPRSSALVAEVLKDYGYATAAWGKWHNTPAEETTAAGPFENWPHRPRLRILLRLPRRRGLAIRAEPGAQHDLRPCRRKLAEEGYHLSEDLADDAIGWLHRHKAFQPDKPFFMYWASGAIHGPHHVTKEWADKYKGKFDDGWDAYRERVFKRAKEKGWIPADAQLTPRHETMPSWDSIPENERPFQRRLMEVAAGFAEHVDVQVGRVVDEIDRLGYGDNTLILYIWGDNGSSAEGQDGTISELLAQNGIPSTVEQHIAALEQLGGLDVLGSPKTDPMYHAGWAWAGSTPYKGTKLLASHFGGTRNPMAVRWPAKIKPDADAASAVSSRQRRCPDDLRDHRHHAAAHGERRRAGPDRRREFRLLFRRSEGQGTVAHPVFRNHGQPRHLSRRLDGLRHGTADPVGAGAAARYSGSGRRTRTSGSFTTWTRTGRQADDLAAGMPEKLAQMKDIFLIEAAKNKALPIGGGLWIPVLHPELRIAPPYTEWTFAGDMVRMPEFCAPALGNKPNVVTIDAVIPDNANGVLYKLGANSGGLTCFVEDGVLCYEYNLFIIQRTKIRAKEKLPTGKVKIEIETRYVAPRPGGPLKITMKAAGKIVAEGQVPISAPLLFTANDCLDIGIALGSPVSLDYYDKAPFKFNGKIDQVHVKYLMPLGNLPRHAVRINRDNSSCMAQPNGSFATNSTLARSVRGRWSYFTLFGMQTIGAVVLIWTGGPRQCQLDPAPRTESKP